MCGIAGRVSSSGLGGLDIVSDMLKSIAYRGPDGLCTWQDTNSNVTLGHCRLAIVDLSDAGNQPMTSSDNRYVIVFNGEIYNHLEIRKDLNSRLEWRGHSDTETLLAAIQFYGVKIALNMCVGMFAIAIWDRERRVLTLGRDRAGEKPLYYGKQNGIFYFSSELSSLLSIKEFEKRIDRRSLAMMLNLKFVPSPNSIFENISMLMPGQVLEISDNLDVIESTSYWNSREIYSNSKKTGTRNSIELIEENLEVLIQQSVSQQLLADVPVGAFLSGGIDSSLIVALMQNVSSSKINTFSVGFENKKFNEANYAAKVASHLGTKHTEQILSDRDIQNVIPLLPSIYSEPFADSSQIPTYLVSKLASQSVTVALSGDGGDELFGGYSRYRSTIARWNILKRFPVGARSLGAEFLARIPAGVLNRIGDRVNDVCRGGGDSLYIGDKLLKGIALINSNSFEQLYYRNFCQWDSNASLVHGVDYTKDSDLDVFFDYPNTSRLEQMMFKDFEFYLLNDILTKVDRAAMSVSVETRVPLLDHRIIEYSWEAMSESYLSIGAPKQILKNILYKYVPKELVDRPKMGFGVPLSDWLKGPLKDWMLDTLSSEKLRRDGLINESLVEKRIQEHLSGTRQWSESLWSLLMYQSWYDLNRSNWK